jgi:serine phosphatase RsbU (regulator of sigma subunit)
VADGEGSRPENTGLACGEVRGGNRQVFATVELPGLRGVLFSSTSDGPHGGDIHYLSVCGSGLLARLCIADVAGHGDAVATVAAEMYDQLRRSVNIIDERRVLRALDRRIVKTGVRAMTTAVLATYYPPGRRLAVSYAGHPPAWISAGPDGRWRPVEPEPAKTSPRTYVGLPLGTGLNPGYTRRKLRVSPGDRLLLLTDGVIEAELDQGRLLGQDGLAGLLASYQGDCEGLVDHVLHGMASRQGQRRFEHDDVTIFAGEFVNGPPGPALWHVFRNRLGFGRSGAVGRLLPLEQDALPGGTEPSDPA